MLLRVCCFGVMGYDNYFTRIAIIIILWDTCMMSYYNIIINLLFDAPVKLSKRATVIAVTGSTLRLLFAPHV